MLEWFQTFRVYIPWVSSVEEVRKSLKEVLELVLEETGDEINHQEFEKFKKILENL